MTNEIDGRIHFEFSLKFTAKEIATWEAWRIRQLFDGIAAVQAAQQGVPHLTRASSEPSP
jgi:hypothetical protein